MTSNARNTITCPTCGSHRIVTHRQRRRSVAEGGILCSACRGVPATRKFKDADLGYWLNAYGASTTTSTAREQIAAGGAPAELVALAQSIFPR